MYLASFISQNIAVSESRAPNPLSHKEASESSVCAPGASGLKAFSDYVVEGACTF